MKLFKHQEEGIKFLQERSKAILADEMGLGKTVQAIFASSGKTVIICPATLKLTPWAEEIAEQIPESNIVVINGKKQEIYKKGTRQFFIINYDVLDKYKNFILANFPDTVILDEAHYIKNTSSKRSKTAIKICEEAKNVYLLTGTPVANRPIEYFNLLKAIDHPLARNYYGYAKKYCGAYLRELRGHKFLDTSGATNLIELHDKTQWSVLRRTKAEVLDLPPKIRAIVPLEMPKEYKTQYMTAWDNFWQNFNDNTKLEDFKTVKEYNKKISNINLAKQMIEIQKCLQIVSLAKMDRIEQDIINIVEQGNKAIIFTRYRETIKQIRQRLEKNKISNVSIDGETSQEHRKDAVKLFQEDDRIKIFVGNLMACAVGITLTKATIVIFADLYWDVTIHDQAEDRAHRIGQNGTVNIYYYAMKNTIDDRIIQILTEKRKIINQVINGQVDKVKSSSGMADLLKGIKDHRA